MKMRKTKTLYCAFRLTSEKKSDRRTKIHTKNLFSTFQSPFSTFQNKLISICVSLCFAANSANYERCHMVDMTCVKELVLKVVLVRNCLLWAHFIAIQQICTFHHIARSIVAFGCKNTREMDILGMNNWWESPARVKGKRVTRSHGLVRGSTKMLHIFWNKC